jgi:hypothetical protein
MYRMPGSESTLGSRQHRQQSLSSLAALPMVANTTHVHVNTVVYVVESALRWYRSRLYQ